MSAQNSSSRQSVESLRAALSAAQSVVIQLESVLAAAEEAAATEAVLAMVETAEEPIPAEPVAVSFVRRDYVGPEVMGDVEHVVGDTFRSGGAYVYLRPFGAGATVEWVGFAVRRDNGVSTDDCCSGGMAWADAVRWGRRMLAKYAAPVAAVVAIAA